MFIGEESDFSWLSRASRFLSRDCPIGGELAERSIVDSFSGLTVASVVYFFFFCNHGIAGLPRFSATLGIGTFTFSASFATWGSGDRDLLNTRGTGLVMPIVCAVDGLSGFEGVTAFFEASWFDFWTIWFLSGLTIVSFFGVTSFLGATTGGVLTGFLAGEIGETGLRTSFLVGEVPLTRADEIGFLSGLLTTGCFLKVLAGYFEVSIFFSCKGFFISGFVADG